MPPKIEEVDGKDRKVIKNPFAPRKSTTVQRSRDEVYPERKGLNKPQYLGDSDLDLIFQRLEGILSPKLEDTTIDGLYKVLFEDRETEDKRWAVVERLLDYLIEIKTYSVKVNAKDNDKNLLSISLHDIRIFAKLVNVIIILGIYPCLHPLRIGIPLEKRRLKDFGSPIYKPITIDQVPAAKGAKSYTERHKQHELLLTMIYNKLTEVFFEKSDVQQLLMKGSGYSDFLTVAITLATVPYFSIEIREKVLREYSTVTTIASTFELYQDYSLLVQSPSPGFFKTFVMQKLQALPYSAPKGDGLLTLMEYVLGLRDQEDIGIEKLDQVASVVLQKPRDCPSSEYFTSIGNQCYDLLVNINRPTITSCTSHVIEKIWYKNPRIVEDFILKRIWRNLDPKPEDTTDMVLVSEAALNNNINVLLTLSSKGLPVPLLMSIFMSILVPLWSYYIFLKSNEASGEVAQNIILGFLACVGTDADALQQGLDLIARNVVSLGGEGWKFRFGPNRLVEIGREDQQVGSDKSAEAKVLDFVKALDNGCKYFVELAKQLDDEPVRRLFVALLRKWLDQGSQSLSEDNSFIRLADLRLLESLAKEFKETLAESPLELFDLIQSVLKHRNDLATEDANMDVDSDDEDADTSGSDELTTVVLELLSAVLSETQPSTLDEDCKNKLAQIKKTLAERFSSLPSATSLSERIGLLLQGDTPAKNETEAHQKIFTRAISNLNDPLVPIRAHGLYLLRSLVEQQSPVLSVDFALNLHLIQLKDPEPFIYLNAIKGLDSLLDWDASTVLPQLVGLYAGTNEEKVDLDERLKIGEVILRFIQSQDEAFTGSLAKTVADGALSLIRRPSGDQPLVDDRLRMSAMSLLGTCCNTNPIGIYDNLENALDCAIGILQLETDKDKAIMRRSAIVLIHDLIVGTSKSDVVAFPASYRDKVLTVLRYVKDNDNDLLTREHAQSVLDTIDELVKALMSTEEE
ncbi:hypothetical protein FT663_02666 [Candidozyma haemuli var. vulneris]|uniref:RNA polymerase II assembly factor Rtp1 C-terminal domain-containing protein n=1 Tax=Candidozyma haemuli TaxID=45357 RepID=A0A2V1ANE6_9ASCO|nr:hypothetical protein CXQ85_001621 [[Candida] haemuloni]KAF3988095.1 hypothetical protein FT662_03630 [[Candida] haemuloni var. vulneris]KAF3991584.1 hypothetical protein FT663_02666 [[Candida] haemuloni var. vulneris]PVH19315.1 hypothetical protein CXQ85_001621 [[Candida] haemuloni]